MLSESYDTIRVLAVVSFVIFGLLLCRRFSNFLFLARTLLLGAVGYFAMAVKVFAGQDALFSLYEPRTQGLDIVVVMYVATSLALLGSEIGLWLGSRQTNRTAVPVPPSQSEF